MKSITDGDLETTFKKQYKVKVPTNIREFKNKFIYIRIDSDGIFSRDLTDISNEESMFTQSKRGLKKCIEYIIATYGDDTKFNDVIKNCEDYNIKYHRYCAMD